MGPEPDSTENPQGKKERKNLPGALVDRVWRIGIEAASQYRPSAARWSLKTSDRRKKLSALIREHPKRGDEVLAQVVHGYRYARRNWSDIDQHFEMNTLLRASKRTDYLEAYDEAIESGVTPPFSRDSRTTGQNARAVDQTRSVAQSIEDQLDARRKRAGETRSDPARGKTDTPDYHPQPLRGVPGDRR